MLSSGIRVVDSLGQKRVWLGREKNEETLDKVQLKNELKAIFCSSRGAEFSFLISHAQLRV